MGNWPLCPLFIFTFVAALNQLMRIKYLYLYLCLFAGRALYLSPLLQFYIKSGDNEKVDVSLVLGQGDKELIEGRFYGDGRKDFMFYI